MTKEKGHPKAAQVDNSNSSAVQRQRLYRELQQRPGGMTTDQIRDELDIMGPAPRIHELRWKDGRNIVTHWERVETQPGKRHLLARYVLLSGRWQGDEI